jgi:arabinose-5-phosphate isomerase
MATHPKWVVPMALAGAALNQMEKYSITSLFVFADEQSAVPVGIVHLHDLLKAGIA